MDDVNTQTPTIQSVTLTPNPASTSASVRISVLVADYLTPSFFTCGESCAGEG